MNHTASPSGGLPEWTLADRLRKIRRDRHLTQQEIADALGIKSVTWSAWESGRNRPEDVLDLAVTIERRYGVPAAWTLGVLNSHDRRRTDTDPLPHPRRRWTDAPGMMATA
jgi:transcriptional regulator with XRE-family HTH domain